MKKRWLVLFLVLSAALGVFAAGTGTQSRVPASAVATITVGNLRGDPGLSWMLESWLKSKRQNSLKEFFKGSAPRELTVAFLPESKDKPMSVVAVVAFPNGATLDKAKLDALIFVAKGDKIQSLSYKGADLRFGSGGGRLSDFGAYAVVQDQLILGTDVDAIKKALDGPAVDASPGYAKANSLAPKGSDGFLFADNAGSKFSDFLSLREKKWNMDLLLSADALSFLSASFDIVSSSKLVGTMVFQASKPDRMGDIKDDAEFIGEAFKRKFIADKIQYSSKVEAKDGTVTLSFQMDGLEPLWLKLFDGGMLELFSPAS